MPARSAKVRRLESAHERSFVRGLRALNLDSLKLNVHGQRGWPDRLVLAPRGQAVFVELKRADETLRTLQAYRREQLERAGFVVVEAAGDDGVLRALQLIQHITEQRS